MGNLINLQTGERSTINTLKMTDRVEKLLRSAIIFERLVCIDNGSNITEVILYYSPFAATSMGLLYPAMTKIPIPDMYRSFLTKDSVDVFIDENIEPLLKEVTQALEYVLKDYTKAVAAIKEFSNEPETRLQ